MKMRMLKWSRDRDHNGEADREEETLGKFNCSFLLPTIERDTKEKKKTNTSEVHRKRTQVNAR